jgi:hypothetical protein
MLSNIANFFLAFSNDILIIPIIILGFIWLNRVVFYHASCIILLSMLFIQYGFKNNLPENLSLWLLFPKWSYASSGSFIWLVGM